MRNLSAVGPASRRASLRQPIGLTGSSRFSQFGLGWGEVTQATERVRQLHLSWCSTEHPHELRASYDDGQALGARYRDIEAVEVVQELHATGCLLWGGRRHRIDDHWRLSSLELVDGA